MLLTQRLQARAQTHGDDIIYRFWSAKGQDEALSYHDLCDRVQRLALVLAQHYEPQSRLLLMYQHNASFIVAFLACLQAQMIAVPMRQLRPNRSLEPLRLITEDAKPSALLTDALLSQRFSKVLAADEILSRLNVVATDTVLQAEKKPETVPQNRPILPLPKAEQIAFLQYTSGSTGQPKGVRVTHANLLHNLGMMQQGAEHTTETRGCSWLPNYHDMGLIGGILQPLFVGLGVNLLSPLAFLQRPIRWLKIISEQGVNSTGGPNFAYQLCVDRIKDEDIIDLDLSHWKVAFVGAEPVHYATLKAFAEKFAACGFRWQAFYPCYGLAEATLIVSGGEVHKAPTCLTVERHALQQHRLQLADAHNEQTQILVSSGYRQSLGQQIYIADPDSDQVYTDGQIGEIVTSSDSVSHGYWQRPDAMPTLTIDGQRCLRTGDLGFLYQDELYVTGRCKELIIIDGQNHYPQDIEASIAHCHSAVYAQAAFAFRHDNSERLGLIIEIHRQWLRKPLEEIVQPLRQRVAQRHELSLGAVLLLKQGGIPVTSSGKIQRLQCQQRYYDNEFKTLMRWEAA